ncbi:hypothetical protein L249_0801 [Ophiocordyceps polyrhachis-furcata BCC 54312]|uniref:Uncharacterized protein n=1 Tax=Ophiocordyceps polyrhachis-furcata BCC 54312 TaxID=1330021 RepID=A0A367LFY0_9HYPO|nr:hypothetical protein L249_0801 [Ophiocordyceps polyrhachis-furcata BCC 54312]
MQTAYVKNFSQGFLAEKFSVGCPAMSEIFRLLPSSTRTSFSVRISTDPGIQYLLDCPSVSIYPESVVARKNPDSSTHALYWLRLNLVELLGEREYPSLGTVVWIQIEAESQLSCLIKRLKDEQYKDTIALLFLIFTLVFIALICYLIYIFLAGFLLLFGFLFNLCSAIFNTSSQRLCITLTEQHLMFSRTKERSINSSFANNLYIVTQPRYYTLKNLVRQASLSHKA